MHDSQFLVHLLREISLFNISANQPSILMSLVKPFCVKIEVAITEHYPPAQYIK